MAKKTTVAETTQEARKETILTEEEKTAINEEKRAKKIQKRKDFAELLYEKYTTHTTSDTPKGYKDNQVLINAISVEKIDNCLKAFSYYGESYGVQMDKFMEDFNNILTSNDKDTQKPIKSPAVMKTLYRAKKEEKVEGILKVFAPNLDTKVKAYKGYIPMLEIVKAAVAEKHKELTGRTPNESIKNLEEGKIEKPQRRNGSRGNRSINSDAMRLALEKARYADAIGAGLKMAKSANKIKEKNDPDKEVI